MSLKHDDLYARAWECEYEKPIFDAENNNATPATSPEIPGQCDLLTEQTRNTPGTAQDCSRENFPQTEELCDVTDTYSYMETNSVSTEQKSSDPPTQFQIQFT